MRELSVVITVLNERDNITPLIGAIREALKDLDYEVIFVDDGSDDGGNDGSSDNSMQIIESFCDIRIILFNQKILNNSILKFKLRALILASSGFSQGPPRYLPSGEVSFVANNL